VTHLLTPKIYTGTLNVQTLIVSLMAPFTRSHRAHGFESDIFIGTVNAKFNNGRPVNGGAGFRAGITTNTQGHVKVIKIKRPHVFESEFCIRIHRPRAALNLKALLHAFEFQTEICVIAFDIYNYKLYDRGMFLVTEISNATFTMMKTGRHVPASALPGFDSSNQAARHPRPKQTAHYEYTRASSTRSPLDHEAHVVPVNKAPAKSVDATPGTSTRNQRYRNRQHRIRRLEAEIIKKKRETAHTNASFPPKAAPTFIPVQQTTAAASATHKFVPPDSNTLFYSRWPRTSASHAATIPVLSSTLPVTTLPVTTLPVTTLPVTTLPVTTLPPSATPSGNDATASVSAEVFPMEISQDLNKATINDSTRSGMAQVHAREHSGVVELDSVCATALPPFPPGSTENPLSVASPPLRLNAGPVDLFSPVPQWITKKKSSTVVTKQTAARSNALGPAATKPRKKPAATKASHYSPRCIVGTKVYPQKTHLSGTMKTATVVASATMSRLQETQKRVCVGLTNHFVSRPGASTQIPKTSTLSDCDQNPATPLAFGHGAANVNEPFTTFAFQTTHAPSPAGNASVCRRVTPPVCTTAVENPLNRVTAPAEVTTPVFELRMPPETAPSIFKNVLSTKSTLFNSGLGCNDTDFPLAAASPCVDSDSSSAVSSRSRATVKHTTTSIPVDSTFDDETYPSFPLSAFFSVGRVPTTRLVNPPTLATSTQPSSMKTTSERVPFRPDANTSSNVGAPMLVDPPTTKPSTAASRNHSFMFGTPTVYNGIRFRSILESKFARLMDALHVRYVYEPIKYNLAEGGTYCIDFFLPDQQLYIELKPKRPHIEEEYKCEEMSTRGFRVVLMYGEVKKPPFRSYATTVTKTGKPIRDYTHNDALRGITWINGVKLPGDAVFVMGKHATFTTPLDITDADKVHVNHLSGALDGRWNHPFIIDAFKTLV
jgi:hypothetical protein